MKKKIAYEDSSGNVFADLGVDNPEEALAKSELARQIGNLIKKKKLTQRQAAEILGIDQPKISALIRGRLRSFSLERLIRFLNELGQDVSIMISPVKSQTGRGSTWIGESHSNTRIAALGR
jgi:predicted XRE-type DNA-binding protein